MQFGYQNPSFNWPSGEYEIWEETKKTALWAEKSGFDSFWLMDHFMQLPGVGSADEPFLEGWSGLAALAAVTSKIRLGTLVTGAPYRNPALLAKMAASIDVISQGRLYFGYGAGWFQTEFDQYGYEFVEPPYKRIKAMREALIIIIKMWTERRASFEGEYYSIRQAILEPKPLQKPRPPILIGGGGEKYTLRYLAELGDACNLFGDFDGVRHKLDVLKGHCRELGRDYEEISKTKYSAYFIRETAAEIEAMPWTAEFNQIGIGLAGSVEQVIEQIGQWGDVGIDTMMVSAPQNDEESKQFLAERVLPACA
ncbi:MAG: LLM class F420-dependent oxidoreductase [Proteobacteria bacterium]|nr:LLM class F420-dependent oxidoreductase [Pseudomonadota bacterium]